jgi:hypothetical protein
MSVTANDEPLKDALQILRKRQECPDQPKILVLRRPSSQLSCAIRCPTPSRDGTSDLEGQATGKFSDSLA